jgi:ankyrin repeat protein
MMAMGDKDIWLKALLDGGLDPNSRDKLLNVPLIFSALSAKNTATLALLIERGADINTGISWVTRRLLTLFKADR